MNAIIKTVRIAAIIRLLMLDYILEPLERISGFGFYGG